MKVVWTDAALDDVAAIFDSITRFNPFAARRVAEALVVAGDSLATSRTAGAMATCRARAS